MNVLKLNGKIVAELDERTTAMFVQWLTANTDAVMGVADVPPPVHDENTDYPHHVGGGYYELPDGSRVRGKDAAEKAMK